MPILTTISNQLIFLDIFQRARFLLSPSLLFLLLYLSFPFSSHPSTFFLLFSFLLFLFAVLFSSILSVISIWFVLISLIQVMFSACHSKRSSAISHVFGMQISFEFGSPNKPSVLDQWRNLLVGPTTHTSDSRNMCGGYNKIGKHGN